MSTQCSSICDSPASSDLFKKERKICDKSDVPTDATNSGIVDQEGLLARRSPFGCGPSYTNAPKSREMKRGYALWQSSIICLYWIRHYLLLNAWKKGGFGFADEVARSPDLGGDPQNLLAD